MTAKDVADAFLPYLLVAALASLWALTEIVQTFRSDVRRALKNGWSVLLLGGNVALALLVFVLARFIFPTTNPYFLALAAGIGWQALLRTRINLFQPLNPEVGEAVSVSLSDLYGRFQRFCWEQIDRSLLAGRIYLLEQAIRLPVEKLEHQVRLFAYASVLYPPEKVEDYLVKLRGLGEEERALALAAYLLVHGGYSLLQERVKAMEK